MFRMEWRQDVDNWSVCVCDCAVSFCSTRARWRGGQVTFGQPGKIDIKRSSTWALQKTRGQLGTHYLFLKIRCVYVWALSVPYPQALILNIASQRLNKLTFWRPVVTALSNISDSWSVKAVPLYDAFNVVKICSYDVKGCRHISSGLNYSLYYEAGCIHQTKYDMVQTCFCSLLDFSWTVLKSWNSLCLNSPSTRFGDLLFLPCSLLAN